MKGAGCDYCGLMQSDLLDGYDDDEDIAELFFDVSFDGRTMACQACSIGREEFEQWDF